MTRVHVVSLPHTLLTRDYEYCAYTAKVCRFVGMLAKADVHALVYGPDVVDPDVRALASDYVPIVTEADRVRWFGAPEWDKDKVFDRWDTADPCWQEMNARAIEQIEERWQAGDIVGVIGGRCQQQIADHFARRGGIITEWGIGYSGVLTNTHKVFESYAWMHHVAGLNRQDDVAFFDTVIPNCFETNDFAFHEQPGDYLLFMGRPIQRKGLAVVEDIAKRVDIPVLVAGQPGHNIANTEYVGLVTGQEKAELLANARAVLAPTTYLEPFGGVAVEAMMSGTPAITTDYGAFTETVLEGITGFRCHTLADFLQAVAQSTDLDRAAIRDIATSRYSTTVGAAKYGRYLRRLETLHADGWYDLSANAGSHSVTS